MIYTVTLNPSLDYTAKSHGFSVGKTNRTTDEYIVPGGKGLNVSIMLKRMGIDSTAYGFSAGFTGEKLKSLMSEFGVNCEFTDIGTGFTRINLKLVSDEVTEFNGSGITVNSESLDILKEKISKIRSGWLVLSGSIPNGCDSNIYKDIMSVTDKSVKIVLDTSGDALKKALSEKPFLVKPNIDELSEFFSTDIPLSMVEIFAEKLQSLGARNVIVSLGGQGSAMLTENGEYIRIPPPDGVMVNTVGAGDSLVAGFIAKFDETEDFRESLKYAVASGSATAYSKWLSEKELIDKLYNTL